MNRKEIKDYLASEEINAILKLEVEDQAKALRLSTEMRMAFISAENKD